MLNYNHTFITINIIRPKYTSATKGHFDIETDPTAYIFYKGYSAHFGYTWRQSRFDVSAVGLQFPGNYNGNKGFTARTNGSGVKWDYINPKLKGFYFGSQSDFYQLRLTNATDGKITSLAQVTMGIRVGYRLMFGMRKGDVKYIFNKKKPVEKGFYINFWCAPIYNPTAENKSVGENTYKIPSITFFPTLHFWMAVLINCQKQTIDEKAIYNCNVSYNF